MLACKCSRVTVIRHRLNFKSITCNLFYTIEKFYKMKNVLFVKIGNSSEISDGRNDRTQV